MKKILFLSLFLSFIFAENIDGFRDIKWGDGIEKLGNYTIRTKNIDVIAVKKDENLKMGDANLTMIKYFFVNNKLYSIRIYYDEDQMPIIMSEIEKKYGLDFIHDKDITSESNGFKIEKNAFGELKIVEDKKYTITPIVNPISFSVRNNDAEIIGDCTAYCSIDINHIQLEIEYQKEILKRAFKN
jgi:hypothetical protein